MIFLLLLLTILATSKGSDGDYSLWDNLNLFQDDEDFVLPIEDPKELESFEAGFVDDIDLPTIDQNPGSPNSVNRSLILECRSCSTEDPEYMDYDESLRINKATPTRKLDEILFYGLLIFGFLF